MRTHQKLAALFCAAAMTMTAFQAVPEIATAPELTASAADTSDPDLIMRYTEEAGTYSKDNAFDNAESFYKALPLGNGRIGAMVYGNCPTEWIDLNECTVWSSGPSNNNREGAANYLKKAQDQQ